jgi:hypothetical protein
MNFEFVLVPAPTAKRRTAIMRRRRPNQKPKLLPTTAGVVENTGEVWDWNSESIFARKIIKIR